MITKDSEYQSWLKWLGQAVRKPPGSHKCKRNDWISFFMKKISRSKRFNHSCHLLYPLSLPVNHLKFILWTNCELWSFYHIQAGLCQGLPVHLKDNTRRTRPWLSIAIISKDFARIIVITYKKFNMPQNS